MKGVLCLTGWRLIVAPSEALRSATLTRFDCLAKLEPGYSEAQLRVY